MELAQQLAAGKHGIEFLGGPLDGRLWFGFGDPMYRSKMGRPADSGPYLLVGEHQSQLAGYGDFGVLVYRWCPDA